MIWELSYPMSLRTYPSPNSTLTLNLLWVEHRRVRGGVGAQLLRYDIDPNFCSNELQFVSQKSISKAKNWFPNHEINLFSLRNFYHQISPQTTESLSKVTKIKEILSNWRSSWFFNSMESMKGEYSYWCRKGLKRKDLFYCALDITYPIS